MRRPHDGRLNARLPKGELARWKAEADALGITLTAYVRAKMNGTTINVARVTDPALYKEARRQGINLNQLMHGMNAGWPVSREQFNNALDALAAVWRRILIDFD